MTALHLQWQKKKVVRVCMSPHVPVNQYEIQQSSCSSSQLFSIKALPITVNLIVRLVTSVHTVEALFRSGSVVLCESAKVLLIYVCLCGQLSVNSSHCCQSTVSVNMCLSPWAGLSVTQLIISLHKESQALQNKWPTRQRRSTHACFC